MASDLLKLGLVVAAGYGIAKVAGGKKKSKKKKTSPPPPAADQEEIVLEGTGYSVNLQAPVFWAVIRDGIKYGWDWEPQLEKDANLGVGSSSFMFDTAEDAKQALIDELNLAPLPDPVTSDDDQSNGGDPSHEEEPPSGAEGEELPPPPPPDPSQGTPDIDYTKVPNFPIGAGGEIHKHLRQGVGIHTIVLLRSKKGNPALGQSGVWGTDWYVWRPGIVLDMSRVHKTGRAADNKKALKAAQQYVESYVLGQGVMSYPVTAYPAGANSLMLPPLTQPGQIATSPHCDVAGVGPAYWDNVGDYVEEIVGNGEYDPQTILSLVEQDYLPPASQLPKPIEQCAGLLAIRNTMLQRIEEYLATLE